MHITKIKAHLIGTALLGNDPNLIKRRPDRLHLRQFVLKRLQHFDAAEVHAKRLERLCELPVKTLCHLGERHRVLVPERPQNVLEHPALHVARSKQSPHDPDMSNINVHRPHAQFPKRFHSQSQNLDISLNALRAKEFAAGHFGFA